MTFLAALYLMEIASYIDTLVISREHTAPGATAHTVALVVRHPHLVHQSGRQVFFFHFLLQSG